MRKYIQELGESPSKDNLAKVKWEIERSETIIKYNQNIINLLESETPWNKKLLSKQLDNIEREKEFIEEANKVKVKIATYLMSKNLY